MDQSTTGDGFQGCHDNSFGPWAGEGCRGGFDFTLLFEEAILTIPLQCLLLLMVPLRISHLAKLENRVNASYLQPLKAAAASCLIGLNVAQVVFWTKDVAGVSHTAATIPAASLCLAASVFVCLLSYLDHGKSVRPSFVLFCYLFLSVLLGLPRLRTVWMLGTDPILPILLTSTVGLQAVMVMLESIEKRSIIKGAPLFATGFKKTMSLDDLYPLDEHLKGQPLHQTLATAWEKVPKKDAPSALFGAWMGAFGKSLVAPIIPRLCMMAFTYAQPFLIKRAIILALLPKTQFFDNSGYGLIGAFALVYTGMAIASGQYMWRVRRTAAKIRGGMFALIYQKSLRLDITSPNVSPMAGITLIGTDVETIIGGMNMIHELWASMTEISIATWLIYRELGPACAMPIALAVINLFATVFIAIPTGKAQATWIQASQERVTATTKTINCIKRLRISGLNDLAFSIVRNLRTEELAKSTKFRYLLGGSLILIIFLPLWSPILTFATWAGVAKSGGGDELSLSKVFASYLFIMLLAGPLTNFLIALPAVAGAVACFQRIQNHLNGKERQDNRLQSGQQQCFSTLTSTDREKNGSANVSIAEEKTASLFVDKPWTQPSIVSLDQNTIAIVKGSFGWQEASAPAINVSEWRVERGTLTFITGPVGCGKSTLLKSLLGELSGFDGTVHTNYSGVAYCDQTPWIPNETVRSIVTASAPKDAVDEAWYRTVTSACALAQDFANWPDRDETLAGSQGIAFSGGQKQRLAIARALYARKEFLIFDDVLSGLDAETENKVFHNVFGRQGLLRRANMTAVCATSTVIRLRYADKIIQLDEKGEIINEGRPEEMLEPLQDGHDMEPEFEDKLEVLAKTQVTTAVEPLEEEEDETRRLGDSTMYLFYAEAAGRGMLVSLAICMAVFAFCQSFPTLWIGWWAGAKDPLDDLGKWLGVYVALGSGAMISVGLGIWQLLILIINRAGMRFHDNLVETVSKAPMAFHSTVDSGITVNRFSQDLRLIDMELPQSLFSVATTTAGGIAQFILVCVVAKYMAAFLPVLALILYIIQFVYLRTSRQLRLLDIEQTAPLYTQLIETLSGLTTIRAFQWEHQFEEKNMGLINNSQRPFYLLASVQSWLCCVTDLFVSIIAIVFAVLATTLREQIGADMIGTGLSNILAFSSSMKSFVTYWVMLETALGAVSRVRRFTSTTPAEGDDDFGVEQPPPEKKWPTEGRIEIQNITASYTSSNPVIKNVSLSIRPGQKLAVCGRTGSGKSSLTLCLLRMMKLDGGSITIDGVDLQSLPHEYVRTHIVALPQDSYIFDGTLRLNVDPGKTATDERIIEVLKQVRLWSKIEARGGLDNVIGDDFFSPGESQVLVFARALLRDSKILILDEFTSSLDADSTAIVEELLATSFTDWTIIAIAHKLQSIVNFDKVAVLDAGRLVEYGAPQELLRKDSLFNGMYHSASEQ